MRDLPEGYVIGTDWGSRLYKLYFEERELASHYVSGYATKRQRRKAVRALRRIARVHHRWGVRPDEA